MLRWTISLCLAAILLAEAADPPWKHISTCLTPQGTPCRTLKWQFNGWQNLSWGFHAVRRWNGTAVLAYSRSGAFMERYSQKAYRNWFLPDPQWQWDRAQIKFVREQQTIEVDHMAREYALRSGVRGGLTVWDAADSDCTKTALAFSLSDLKRQGEDVIAGFRSIGYTGLRSKHERTDVWLSPALGCTQMKVLTFAHNSIGLPTSYSRLELVLVRIEPDERMFEAPAVYRKVR